MRAVAAVLAAGGSSRLGRPKQLLQFRGQSLLRHAVQIALGAGCDETIVIVPPGEFRSELEGLDVAIVENPAWTEGISSSIRAAADSAPGSRLLITLCDQPLLTSRHLEQLLSVSAQIVATGYNGIAGVPAVFAPEMHDELRALRGDRGARSVIERHRDVAKVVTCEDAAIDVDCEEDVWALSSKL